MPRFTEETVQHLMDERVRTDGCAGRADRARSKSVTGPGGSRPC
jgi:hypothetical protein